MVAICIRSSFSFVASVFAVVFGVWNYLPTDLRQPDLSYSRFGQSLKTFLYGQWDHSAV